MMMMHEQATRRMKDNRGGAIFLFVAVSVFIAAVTGVSSFCVSSTTTRPATATVGWTHPPPARSVMFSSSQKGGGGGKDGDEEQASSHATITIVESDFAGAGVPRPDLAPGEIPSLLMQALECNDFPAVDDGLRSVWAFSGDATRFVFGDNETEFVASAHQTAEEFPTSFYGSAMNGQSWQVETPINLVGGGGDGDGEKKKNQTAWIATQVIRTVSSDGRLRRWQWELRKHRRPPNLGCWYVESIGSSDRKGQFEAE